MHVTVCAPARCSRSAAQSSSRRAAVSSPPARSGERSSAHSVSRRALALFDRSGTADIQQHEAPVRSIFWEPRLVADGLTNQQIADRLHISRKTVEMHLTRTFAKLGISHRSALAHLLAGGRPHTS